MPGSTLEIDELLRRLSTGSDGRLTAEAQRALQNPELQQLLRQALLRQSPADLLRGAIPSASGINGLGNSGVSNNGTNNSNSNNGSNQGGATNQSAARSSESFWQRSGLAQHPISRGWRKLTGQAEPASASEQQSLATDPAPSGLAESSTQTAGGTRSNTVAQDIRLAPSSPPKIQRSNVGGDNFEGNSFEESTADGVPPETSAVERARRLADETWRASQLPRADSGNGPVVGAQPRPTPNRRSNPLRTIDDHPPHSPQLPPNAGSPRTEERIRKQFEESLPMSNALPGSVSASDLAGIDQALRSLGQDPNQGVSPELLQTLQDLIRKQQRNVEDARQANRSPTNAMDATPSNSRDVSRAAGVPEDGQLDAETSQRLLTKLTEVGGPGFAPLLDELRRMAVQQKASTPGAKGSPLSTLADESPIAKPSDISSMTKASQSVVESMLKTFDDRATKLIEQAMRNKDNGKWMGKINRSLQRRVQSLNRVLRRHAGSSLPAISTRGKSVGGLLGRGYGFGLDSTLFANLTIVSVLLLTLALFLSQSRKPWTFVKWWTVPTKSLCTARNMTTPSEVVDRETLVQACHSVAIMKIGSEVIDWHHRRLFQQLAKRLPHSADDELNWLMSIYEQSRYAAQNFELTGEQATRARSVLMSFERSLQSPSAPSSPLSVRLST